MTSSRRSSLRVRQQRRAFNTRRRAAFYADMARFTTAGIPPYDALKKLAEVARRVRHHKIEGLYRRVMRAMDAGEDLAAAVAVEVPGAEAVMLTGAGGAGPDVLTRALEEMGALLRRQLVARQKLVKAFLSNGLALAAIVGVIVMIMHMVVPELESSTTPAMARHMSFAPAYFAFGDALMAYGVYIVIGVGALVAAIVWSMPRWHRRRRYWSRRWFDRHLLPWTFYARTQATFFLMAAAMMLRAGVPVRDVLTGMQKNATGWMRAHLRNMLRRLAKGHSAVESMDVGMLPSDTANRLAVYTLIPDFTEVMSRLAEDNFDSYERGIDALAGFLRLVSIILLALFIASTLFAVFDFSNALTASTSISGM